MASYTVKAIRHYEYEVVVDAEDEFDALDQMKDWEIEDFEPFESDAYWNFDVVGYPEDEEDDE